MTTAWQWLAEERGIVLVVSLLLLALLLAAGVGAIVSMQTDMRTSGNLAAAAQAFYIAEAGINHARQELEDLDSPNFDTIFDAPDGSVIVSNSSFYGGSYTVTRQGSTPAPRRIKVVSVGLGPRGARADIEVWFRRDDGGPRKAIVAQDRLEIPGSPQLLGICGGAHANRYLHVDGDPAVQMASGLSSSSLGRWRPLGIDMHGSPCIGSAACATSPRPAEYVLDTWRERRDYEKANEKAPAEPIPGFSAADYAKLVAATSASNHYILNRYGTVTTGGTCGSTGYCSGGSLVSPPPSGWIFSDGKWTVAGSNAAAGVFYSETEVVISGNPGTPTSPWEATIISRGDITINSSPHIRPYPTPSLELRNHLLVAGGDLRISGDMKAGYAAGAILVRDDLQIDASPTIKGFVIVGNDVEAITGNPQITYNCDFGCSGPGCPLAVGQASWRQNF